MKIKYRKRDNEHQFTTDELPGIVFCGKDLWVLFHSLPMKVGKAFSRIHGKTVTFTHSITYHQFLRKVEQGWEVHTVNHPGRRYSWKLKCRGLVIGPDTRYSRERDAVRAARSAAKRFGMRLL